MNKDKQGREYAKLSDLKAGDTIETDGDFTCGIKNKKLIVEQSDHGLYVSCNEGHHYLDGQLEDDGYLMGIYHVK